MLTRETIIANRNIEPLFRSPLESAIAAYHERDEWETADTESRNWYKEYLEDMEARRQGAEVVG